MIGCKEMLLAFHDDDVAYYTFRNIKSNVHGVGLKPANDIEEACSVTFGCFVQTKT